jgi:hypothetical protein
MNAPLSSRVADALRWERRGRRRGRAPTRRDVSRRTGDEDKDALVEVRDDRCGSSSALYLAPPPTLHVSTSYRAQESPGARARCRFTGRRSRRSLILISNFISLPHRHPPCTLHTARICIHICSAPGQVSRRWRARTVTLLGAGVGALPLRASAYAHRNRTALLACAFPLLSLVVSRSAPLVPIVMVLCAGCVAPHPGLHPAAS